MDVEAMARNYIGYQTALAWDGVGGLGMALMTKFLNISIEALSIP